MNTMASIAGIGLIFGIFMTLLPIALLVVLQVWLCRKGKWLGLILPALSLMMSLLLVLSVGAFNWAGAGVVTRYDGSGNIVEQHHQEPEHNRLTPGAAGAVAVLFLVTNIPTVVFGGVWLYYKNRRDFQEDLKKMKIEDLE